MLELIKNKINDLDALLAKADRGEIPENDPKITGTDYIIKNLAEAFNMSIASCGLPKPIEVVMPYVKRYGQTWIVSTRDYHIYQLASADDRSLEKFIVLLERVGINLGTKIGQNIRFHGSPFTGIESLDCHWEVDGEEHHIGIDMNAMDYLYTVKNSNGSHTVGSGDLDELA